MLVGVCRQCGASFIVDALCEHCVERAVRDAALLLSTRPHCISRHAHTVMQHASMHTATLCMLLHVDARHTVTCTSHALTLHRITRDT